MRLVQFVDKNSELRAPYHRITCNIGAFKDASETTIVNLSLLPQIKENNIIDMVTLLTAGPAFLKSLQEAAKNANLPEIKRTDVRILPPITSPDKIIGVRENFRDHCIDKGIPFPTLPRVFLKLPNSIVGPEDNVKKIATMEKLDWEIELAFVIGTQIPAGSNPSKEACCAAIAGYMLAEDLTLVSAEAPFDKGTDGLCPLGSSLITADEFPDDFAVNVAPYKMENRVSGVVRQSSDLTQLLFKPVEIIANITQFLTLQPGDFVCTGTPSGVGWLHKPPIFMKAGDILAGSIENLGSIVNKIE